MTPGLGFAPNACRIGWRNLPVIASHYDVLGLGPHASPQQIREAYRARARRHHPDRAESGSAAGGAASDMSAINEAYRVLGDPDRRAAYDRSLTRGSGTARRAPGSPGGTGADADEVIARWTAEQTERTSPLSPAGPAKLPWKMMLVAAVVGSAVILFGAAFNDPPAVEQPDGVLRVGSCVAIDANNLAREVACTGTDADVIVQLVLPGDGRCPFPLLAHRDRLGLGLACIPAE